MRTRSLYILIVISDKLRDAHSQLFYTRESAERWAKGQMDCEDLSWFDFQKYLAKHKPHLTVHIQKIDMEL